MSYADWEADDRIPKSAAEFERIEEYLLTKSPFLRSFFAEHSFTGRRVLDLGCGVGVLSCLLARMGASVTAGDITAQGVALTNQNAAARNLPVRIVRTDAEALGFADESFEFVVSWGVVHHSPNTERALSEVARVLVPGGRGLLMVYHRSSLVYYLRGLYWLIFRGKLWQGHSLDTVQDFFVDGFYHRHFRRDEFAACLNAVGLRPFRILATQQDEPILPFIRGGIDLALKRRFGWYLVAEIEKPK